MTRILAVDDSPSMRDMVRIALSGATIRPRSEITVRAASTSGEARVFTARVRIDTPEELTAFAHGGILPYVLRKLVG